MIRNSILQPISPSFLRSRREKKYLREIVGSNLLTSICAFDLSLSNGSSSLHLEIQTSIHQSCSENFVRFRSVLILVSGVSNRESSGPRVGSGNLALRRKCRWGCG